MKTKNQTFDIFQKFICQADHQFRKKFRHLYTNFESKFTNKVFEKYIAKEKIKLESSVPYTSKQNGKVKCLNCTLMSLVQFILTAIYLPKRL